MKRFFSALAIIVLIALAAVAAAALIPPTGYAKTWLVKQVRQQTGLELKAGGHMSLRLLPNLNVRLEDVELSNPAAGAQEKLGTAKAVEVRTDLWPLVWGSRHIDRVRLVEPTVTLAVAKDGKTNWSLAGPAAQGGQPGTSATAKPGVSTLQIAGGSMQLKDERDGTTVSLEKLDATINDVSAAGFADASVKSASASLSLPQDGTTVKLADVDATAGKLDGDRLAEIKLTSRAFTAEGARLKGTAQAEQVNGTARDLSAAGAGAVAVSSAQFAWTAPADGGRLSARDLAISLASVASGKLNDVKLKSASLGYGSSTARATPTSIEQVTASMATLALNIPIEADVAFDLNKERVTGRARLPAPDAIAMGAAVAPAIRQLSGQPTAVAAIPATLAFKSAKGDLDFTGDIEPGESPRFKGKTRAAAPSLQAFAQWLGLTLPPAATGAASFEGALDATAKRISLTDGRIRHDATVVDGTVAIDMSGARPAISGKLTADKFDANTYLGIKPSAKPAKPAGTRDIGDSASEAVIVTPAVPVKEALKTYMRAVLNAPLTRSGTLSMDVPLEALNRSPTLSRAPGKKPAADEEWSNDPIDLSALKDVDLDLDVAVKTLIVRDLEVAVPSLKANLKDGTLALDGRDIATRTGKITGKATIDARQAVPQIQTSFRASDVDIYDLMKSTGANPVVAGPSTVVADLSSSGNSQLQIAKSLSGTVKAQMRQGQVIGYDFSNILGWIFGNRTYDPRNRTPFNRLDANIAFDKGVARNSTMELEGPVLGANADGVIKLADKEIDYRARVKLAAFFSALSLRIFGDWDKPSVSPDLDVFSRSPTTTTNPLALLVNADLADPELASLIGQVLEKAGPRGLNAEVADTLRALQSKAQAK